MNRTATNIACTACALIIACPVVADENSLTFIEAFENGTNVGEWTWGNRIQERNVPAQGNPGTWRYNYGLFDCCAMANGGRVSGVGPNIFTGNWQEMGVRSIGIDISVLLSVFSSQLPPPSCHYHGFVTGPGAGAKEFEPTSPVSLYSSQHVLRDRALQEENWLTPSQVLEYIAAAKEHGKAAQPTGGEEPDAYVWLLLATGTEDDTVESFGAIIPVPAFGSVPGEDGNEIQPHPEWYEFDLDIPEEWLFAETAPEEALIINMSGGSEPPPDSSWPDLITNIEWLSFVANASMHPDYFFPFLEWRVGLDNPRITIAAENNLPDCTGTGNPDIYDIAVGLSNDCNRSGVPDICEIDLGIVADCTGNGIPDACEAADAAYRLDSGFHNEAIGNLVDDNIIWAMRFDANDGDVIENISVAFHGTPNVPGLLHPGDPVTLLLWDDPSNDGSPQDAELLVAIERKVLTVNSFFGTDRMVSFDTYEIEPTEVSGSFFVGAMAPGLTFPAMLDFTNLHEDRSFSVGLSSTGDPEVAFHDATNLIATCMSGTFMIRANGNDANNTGKPDICDEEDCAPADLNCDGVVDIDDLFILLAAWGECDDPDDCPADLDGNGVVDVDDLFILLANWG